MSSVITVENLGKRYSLANTAAPAYSTLRDVMADAARRFLRREPVIEARAAKDFWALRNVSFEVKEGESSALSGATALARARC